MKVQVKDEQGIDQAGNKHPAPGIEDGTHECELKWQYENNFGSWINDDSEDIALKTFYQTRQIWVLAEQEKDVKREMPIINKVRTSVEPTKDFVGDFFGEIHKSYTGDKMIEVKDFNNSDTRLSLLKVDDKTVAMVVESRTAFNHCEYVFCQEPSTHIAELEARVAELEGVLKQMGEVDIEMITKIYDRATNALKNQQP